MNAGASLEFPLRIREVGNIARASEPVRFGVPLPRGLVRNPQDLCLEDSSGKALPLQARVLASWSDGSVRWILIDTLLDLAAAGEAVLRLRRVEGKSTEEQLEVSRAGSSITIDTGAARFQLPCSGPCLIDSVLVDGKEQLGQGGVEILYEGAAQQVCRPRIVDVQVAEIGPLRATVRVEGVIDGTGTRRPLEFSAQLCFSARSAVVEIEFRLRNPRRALHRGGLWDLGDPGSQHIRELSIALTPASAPHSCWLEPAPDREPVALAAGGGCVLYQDSSGGEHWRSPNHVDADGELGVRFRGYQVSNGEGQILDSGERATPRIELSCAQGAIAGGIDKFWQNFPKAVRLTRDRLHLVLFPRESRRPTELQGGEQKRHRIWFAFGAPGESRMQIAHRQKPPQVILEPAAVDASQAVYGFSAIDAAEHPAYSRYMQTIVDGPSSFFAGREAIDEFGWRHFGDVYADHEAVHHKGPEPFVSHYNNQYDVVFGLLRQGLRSGDARWFELATDLVRHVSDIDIYHTQDDKAAYNGGLFWHSDHYLPAGLATHRTYSRLNAKGSYGGGPDNEHNYTSGLLTWYFLTGDREAADAVKSLADFVMAADDGRRTLLRFLSSAPTGNASKTVSPDYHGPGRGAGNSINALLDAYCLFGERSYMSKAEELIQRCVHPDDDIAELNLDEPEVRWSYLVFLQSLAKYLCMKREADEEDDRFFYAVDSLLHYARWMLLNERPYSELLHKVLLPTETWPAQDVRKARVLEAAAQYCTDEEERQAMFRMSAQFMERCLTDVLKYQTSHLVRPRVLLAVYGGAVRFEMTPKMKHSVEEPRKYSRKVRFLPQKARVKRMLKGRFGQS